jgi:hypothetical protein
MTIAPSDERRLSMITTLIAALEVNAVDAAGFDTLCRHYLEKFGAAEAIAIARAVRDAPPHSARRAYPVVSRLLSGLLYLLNDTSLTEADIDALPQAIERILASCAPEWSTEDRLSELGDAQVYGSLIKVLITA